MRRSDQLAAFAAATSTADDLAALARRRACGTRLCGRDLLPGTLLADGPSGAMPAPAPDDGMRVRPQGRRLVERASPLLC